MSVIFPNQAAPPYGVEYPLSSMSASVSCTCLPLKILNGKNQLDLNFKRDRFTNNVPCLVPEFTVNIPRSSLPHMSRLKQSNHFWTNVQEFHWHSANTTHHIWICTFNLRISRNIGIINFVFWIDTVWFYSQKKSTPMLKWKSGTKSQSLNQQDWKACRLPCMKQVSLFEAILDPPIVGGSQSHLRRIWESMSCQHWSGPAAASGLQAHSLLPGTWTTVDINISRESMEWIYSSENDIDNNQGE